MRWKGQDLNTYSEYLNAMGALTKDNVEEFLERAYADRPEDPETVRKNLGYLTGYLNPDHGEKIRRLMGIPHPVYGMRAQGMPGKPKE